MDDLLREVPENDAELKSCCANLYENEMVKFFLGESYHPGGLALTKKLAGKLSLQAGQRVLDIACGPGTSVLALAREYGVKVTGLDLSEKNCHSGRQGAEKEGLGKLVDFVQGDAETLPFAEQTFDAVISECSFCTFPDKESAAAEMFRVLRSGGRIGITDVILNTELPDKWKNHVSHILCLADAQSFEGYTRYLTKARFGQVTCFDESHALVALADQIKAKLLLVQLAAGLGKLSIPSFDIKEANQTIKEVLEFIRAKRAGYGMITGTRQASELTGS